MSTTDPNFQKRFVPGILLALTIATFAGLIVFTLSQKKPYNPETLCPINEDYPQTAVLIDATDSLNPNQILAVVEEIDNLRKRSKANGKLAINEWVGIFVLNEDDLILPKPKIALCYPGDGTDVNPLFENPDQARIKFERKFFTPMKEEIENLAQLSPSPTSPIFEMIRSIVLDVLDRNFNPAKGRRLIIVSDMLHNVPEYSHYQDKIDFSAWEKTSYAHEFLQLSLLNMDVEILYLKRVDGRARSRQTRGHVLFWEKYFDSVGATVKRLKPLT